MHAVRVRLGIVAVVSKLSVEAGAERRLLSCRLISTTALRPALF